MSKVSVRTLGDLCEVVNGSTPNTKDSGFWGGPHQWVTPKEMGSLKSPFISRSARTLSDSGLNSISAKLLPKFSIILSSRAPIGYLAVNKEPMATNQGCKGLIPSAELDYMFLYYFLLANRERLNSLGTGTTFAELSSTALKRFEIPLPPLDEQKRIVAKLDKIQTEVGHMLSNLYERLQAVNSLRGAALANRLKGTNSAVTPSATEEHRGTEWPLVRLGELVSLEYGKPLPPEKRNAEGAHPVYGANGVKTLTDEYLVEGDSIIVGRKGSAGEIARVSGRWWPLDVTYYVLVKTDGLDMGYLFLVLMGLNLPSLARGVKPGINRNDVYDLMISLPDLAEQKRIVAELDELAVELDDLEAKVVAQKSLVSAFQSAALSTALAGGV